MARSEQAHLVLLAPSPVLPQVQLESLPGQVLHPCQERPGGRQEAQPQRHREQMISSYVRVSVQGTVIPRMLRSFWLRNLNARQ